MQDIWASRNMSRNDSSSTLFRLCWLILLFSSQLWAVLRIWDVYSGSQILFFTHLRSQISEPKTATKEKVKKLWCHIFFCSHKFLKIENNFIWNAEEKNVGQFSKNYRTFYPKIVTKLSKIQYEFGIRDPGKTYFGTRGQKGTVSQIPDPQHWLWGKKLTHLVSWFVSLLDKSWRTRFSVSFVSSSIFSCNSREQSILVLNFSVFICRRFQMLWKFV